jgi:hypothetical protein
MHCLEAAAAHGEWLGRLSCRCSVTCLRMHRRQLAAPSLSAIFSRDAPAMATTRGAVLRERLLRKGGTVRGRHGVRWRPARHDAAYIEDKSLIVSTSFACRL